jgi:hypothetical protein
MNIKPILIRVSKLSPTSPALFGKMTGHHMVEHLILTVKVSYGKIKIPDFEPSEKQLAQKQALIYTAMDFPKGIIAPGIGEQLLPLRFPDLEAAKEELVNSIEEYNSFFSENPDARTIHPRLGKLTYSEWEIFHGKHIDHHLSQFGI